MFTLPRLSLLTAGLLMSLFLPNHLAAFAVPTPADLGTVRFNVTLPPTPANTSWLNSLRSWLGISAVTRYKPDPGATFSVTASGYAPSPYQTDSTPCLTAAGTRVRQGTVAANFLPLGTILAIDGQIYIVEDRMNARYRQQLDIFFLHTSDALEFGRQPLTVTILGYGTPGQSLANLLTPPDSSASADDPVDLREPAPGVSLSDRLLGQYYFLRRAASGLIGARSGADPNRYDIDCLSAADESS